MIGIMCSFIVFMKVVNFFRKILVEIFQLFLVRIRLRLYLNQLREGIGLLWVLLFMIFFYIEWEVQRFVVLEYIGVIDRFYGDRLGGRGGVVFVIEIGSDLILLIVWVGQSVMQFLKVF